MHCYLKANCVQLVHAWEYKRWHKERFASKKPFYPLIILESEEQKMANSAKCIISLRIYFFAEKSLGLCWKLKYLARPSNDSTVLSALCSNGPTFKSLDFIWQLKFFAPFSRLPLPESRLFNEWMGNTQCTNVFVYGRVWTAMAAERYMCE